MKSFSLDGKESSPMNTIFPILRIGNDGRYTLIGTGFFIGSNGLFATAKHVLADDVDENGSLTKKLVIIHFAEKYAIREIEMVAFHPKADVAVGKVKTLIFRETNTHLENNCSAIGNQKPKNGDILSTYCYPKTTISYSEIQQINIETTVYHGPVEEVFPEGRDRVMLPSACYQVKMGIIGGASGGPVFNEKGLVVAINSSSYENDEITFVSCITDIFDLDIHINAAKKINPNYVKDRIFIL